MYVSWKHEFFSQFEGSPLIIKNIIIFGKVYYVRFTMFADLYYRTRWMYWTSYYKIERSSMDGSNRTLIANTADSTSYGLTIDCVRQELYWTDYHSHIIERCNVDGSNRQTIEVQDIRYPYDIVFFEDALYIGMQTEVKRTARDGGVSTTILNGLSGNGKLQVVSNQVQGLCELS